MGREGAFSTQGGKQGLLMQPKSVTISLAWQCQGVTRLYTRTPGQIDRCVDMEDKGPSSRQRGFFQGLWL